MTKYVAFLRGIGPGNPNMHNEKLRGVFESLGFNNVRSVISSGNVLFESNLKDTKKMEKMIEDAWPVQLGFTSTTIIRSLEELESLIALSPFNGLEHTPKTNLNVTFLKSEPLRLPTLPYAPEGKGYSVVNIAPKTLFSVVDLNNAKTPDLMTWLEKQFSKKITTRTWKTVNRVVEKLKQ